MYTKLVLFSPIRCGSSFVWNILNSVKDRLPIIDKTRIDKHHGFQFVDDTVYVVTIRHPYNSIISLLSLKYKTINVENLQKCISEYLFDGGGHHLICNSSRDLRKLKDIKTQNLTTTTNLCLYPHKDKPNIFILKYEDFIDNNEKIFEMLSGLGVLVSSEEKSLLLEKFGINNISNVKNDWFWSRFPHLKLSTEERNAYFDNHISKYAGKTDYRKILTHDLIKILKNNEEIQQIIKLWYCRILQYHAF